MTAVRYMHFSLTIDAAEYLRVYEDPSIVVNVQTHEGLSLQFPADKLKPYLTHSGISGEFRIGFDANNKFVLLERLA